MLKIVNVSTVSSWQQELYMLSISDSPTDTQNPEPAQIFSIILFHSNCLSFPHHGYLVRYCEAEKTAQTSP